MRTYRIVNEPDFRTNWFYAEERILFFWRYVSNSMSSSREEAERKLTQIVAERKTYKKRTIWMGQL